MGQCIGRRSGDSFSDVHPHIFSVLNINENGRVEGRIEVTEADLILNQRGHVRIWWPLRSLRRFGFEAGVFSFESERWCPTGPGIYAFRCTRAQDLFNLLQSRVRNQYTPKDQNPRPDPRRENGPSITHRALHLNPMPYVAPGSYINITPSPQNNGQEWDPIGIPPLETITTSDLQQHTTSNTISSNLQPCHLEAENPSAVVASSSNETLPLLPGLNIMNEDNNETTSIELNGIIPTITQDVVGLEEKKQKMNIVISNFKEKPSMLDLSSNHHLIHQRVSTEVPPTYENIHLSQCPPPLPPKPTTPISPPTPVHTEIRNTSPCKPFTAGLFFKDRIPPLFEDNIHDAEENDPPTKTQQLVYAQLDLSQPASNIHYSQSSMMNAIYNRSPSFTPNPDLSPANLLSKSADSPLLGNPSALMSNGLAAQEEKIECSEYTHIDHSRTQAYLESKLQNENKKQFPFDGASSNFASNFKTGLLAQME